MSRDLYSRVKRIEQALASPDQIDPEVDLPMLRHMLTASLPYDPSEGQTKREWEAWIEELAQLMASDATPR